MTQGCTCCAVHGMGAHLEQITAPPIPETPEVRSAEKRLIEAVAAETRARDEWVALNLEHRRMVDEFVQLWGSVDYAPKAARDTQAKQLDGPTKKAQAAFEAYQARGRETVEARQRAAAAQHEATQKAVASW